MREDFLKLLIPVTWFVTQTILYFLNEKVNDKRIRRKLMLKRLLLVLALISTLAAMYIIFIDSSNNKMLENQISYINNNLIEARKSEKEAIQQRINIREELTEIQIKVESIVELARVHNPNLTENEALDYVLTKLDFAIEMSTRDILKKSNLTIDDDLFKELIQWYSENENAIVDLKLLNGSQKNTMIAFNILNATLEKAGIKTIKSTSMMGLNSSGTIFTVEYPKNFEAQTKELMNILQRKFVGDVSFSEHSENSIWIWIHGFPEFSSDGRIVYK